MFSGLIQEVGKVVSLRRHSRGAKLCVETNKDAVIGESIAVNGVCLTVSQVEKDCFTCDLLPESLGVTNLGELKPGSRVNMEYALLVGDKIGGHIVNGHVDGVGIVRKISKSPYSLSIELGKDLFDYIVPKASVAVDGISLTIGPKPVDGYFNVFIIPHTWENTNLRFVRPGYRANIEIDILARYVMEFVGKLK
ncbi:riboflavin synthase [bacterium]|nr:riboflavin synthase [bacterium]